MNVKVLHQQSLLDKAIQEYGDVRAVFDLALKNSISLTDELQTGEELTTLASVYTDTDIHKYYKRKELIPATALTKKQSEEINPEGINFWAIQVDFIVS